MNPSELVVQYTKYCEELDRIKIAKDHVFNAFERIAEQEFKRFAKLKTCVLTHNKKIVIYVGPFDDCYPLKGGGWCREDPLDARGLKSYAIPCDGPIDWNDFDAEVQAIGRRLCCSIIYKEKEQRPAGGIENIVALRMLHPKKDVKLVEQGRVEYSGWDITDPYYKATIDGVLWAFWDDSGHGYGIKRSAQFDSEDWPDFELFLNQGTVIKG